MSISLHPVLPDTTSPKLEGDFRGKLPSLVTWWHTVISVDFSTKF